MCKILQSVYIVMGENNVSLLESVGLVCNVIDLSLQWVLQLEVLREENMTHHGWEARLLISVKT